MQTNQPGITPRELEKTKQAIWKARGLALKELEVGRLGVYVALRSKKAQRGFDVILNNDGEAEAFRDGLRLASL